MAMDQLYTDALKELEQVKAERDAAIKRAQVVEDERDALAAHVERQADLLSWARDMLTHDTVASRKWHAAVNSAECESPATSLALREALRQVEVLEKAKASCEHIAKGQEKLAWMHSKTLADGEEVVGEQGIPYSNKALGAAHCADEIGRLATKLRRQAEAGQ